jgi:hypothetical protein
MDPEVVKKTLRPNRHESSSATPSNSPPKEVSRLRLERASTQGDDSTDRYFRYSTPEIGYRDRKNKVPVLFDPFYQVDFRYVSRRYGGTGLVLRIPPAKLAQAMGGTVNGKDVLGSGEAVSLA